MTFSLDIITVVFNKLDVATRTRKEYIKAVKTFCEFVRNRDDLSDSLFDFKMKLASSDLSNSRKNVLLTSARHLLQSMRITHESVNNFANNRKHKRTGISFSEFKRLKDALKDEHIELKVIVSLLVFCGLRQVEVSRLNLKDIDVQRKIILVAGKARDNDKEIVLLQKEAHLAVLEYLLEKRNSLKTKSEAFIQSQKKTRFSTSQIRRLVKDLFVRLEINNSTHALRHFFVTQMLKTFDAITTAKFSRHRTLDTLKVYDDELQLDKYIDKYDNSVFE